MNRTFILTLLLLLVATCALLFAFLKKNDENDPEVEEKKKKAMIVGWSIFSLVIAYHIVVIVYNRSRPTKNRYHRALNSPMRDRFGKEDDTFTKLASAFGFGKKRRGRKMKKKRGRK